MAGRALPAPRAARPRRRSSSGSVSAHTARIHTCVGAPACISSHICRESCQQLAGTGRPPPPPQVPGSMGQHVSPE
eukprot:364906-Chlamydomonas_euryale.AAC.16